MNTEHYLKQKDRNSPPIRKPSELERKIEDIQAPSLQRRILHSPEILKHQEHCKTFGITRVRLGREDIDLRTNEFEERLMRQQTTPSPPQEKQTSRQENPIDKEEHAPRHRTTELQEFNPPYGGKTIEASCQCGQTIPVSSTDNNYFPNLQKPESPKSASYLAKGQETSSTTYGTSTTPTSTYNPATQKKKTNDAYRH